MKFINQAMLLQTKRVSADVSQEKLADAMNVNCQYISNMERGLCPIPPKHVKTICKVIGISTYEVKSAFMKDTEHLWTEKTKK